METYQVPMNDGVALATDIYLPEGAGPWPVLILRTPYRKAQFRRSLGPLLAAQGYAVLAQDVRGTGESEGRFGFYAQEPADALSTAEWLLRQPFSDGRLGILGISYLAGASIAIAAALPDRVKACVWLTIPISRDLLAWEGGAFRLHHALPWSMLVKEAPPLKPRDWAATYATLPLAAAAPDSEFWQVYVSHDQPDDPFWQANDLTAYLDRIHVPGLHAGGWYCFVNDATVIPYRRMAASSRAPQKLMIGPWSHNGILIAPEFQRAMAAFLAECFEGAADSSAPVRLLPGGEEATWIDLDAWPEPNLTLYLDAGGRLSPGPVADGADGFTADPLNPVPTQGGSVWEFPAIGLVPGPTVQTTVERPDVLTYETEPLSAPLTLAGAMVAEIHGSADTVDADFTAKLTDVAPDGTARFICDGIIRGRFREGTAQPSLLTPGEVYRFTIAMHAGHVLAAGHRLRLEVAGSNFPKFDRNLHHGGSGMHSGRETAVVSHRRVLRGASRLLLTTAGGSAEGSAEGSAGTCLRPGFAGPASGAAS